MGPRYIYKRWKRQRLTSRAHSTRNWTQRPSILHVCISVESSRVLSCYKPLEAKSRRHFVYYEPFACALSWQIKLWLREWDGNLIDLWQVLKDKLKKDSLTREDILKFFQRYRTFNEDRKIITVLITDQRNQADSRFENLHKMEFEFYINIQKTFHVIMAGTSDTE